MRLISLVFLLVGCGREAAAPDAARPKDAGPPDALATRAVPQEVPRVTALEEALTLAEACVIEGRPRRGCLQYDRLMEAVRVPANAGWFEEILTLARGPADAPHTRLVLTLLADGAVEGPSERFVATLLPLADATVPFVRAQAIRALAPHDGPGVVEKALNLAESDPDPEVRESATLLIGSPQQARAGKVAVTTLLRVLANDTDPSVKRAAIGALSLFKPAEALPTLIALMGDPLLGPNATLEVGGYPQSAAYRAILARIAEAKEGRDLPPATLAALGRLRWHPEYDAAQVRQLLQVVQPFAEKDGSPTGQIALEMLKRHLESLPPLGLPPLPDGPLPGEGPVKGP